MSGKFAQENECIAKQTVADFLRPDAWPLLDSPYSLPPSFSRSKPINFQMHKNDEETIIMKIETNKVGSGEVGGRCVTVAAWPNLIKLPV